MLYAGDERKHNNPNLAYVDAESVRGGNRVTANLSTLLSDFTNKLDQLKEHVTRVYVRSEDKDYRLKNKARINDLMDGWAVVNAVSDVSDKEDKINKVQTVSSLTQATPTNYPSERAVRLLHDQEIADRNSAISNAINSIKDDVNPQFDTLKKIADAFVGSPVQKSFSSLTERNAFNVSRLPFQAFVTNDGDGKWALYQAISTGSSATYVKISDPDLLNTALSDQQIKAAYERNLDTNVFTNADKEKLSGVTKDFTLSFPQPVRFYKDYFQNDVVISEAIGDGVNLLRYSTDGGKVFEQITLPFSGSLKIRAGWIIWRIDFPNTTVALAAVNIKLL
ncbi:hypothetical protein [uncultured Mucilaginibacter sp.]|uniref:hypothetical protein n=1 Tax=uncultured Mucilaginibacter sp. TaxID=797541 RepID=UPI0025D4EACB|nr:hypothetical protein [uncultured Mucilaginibacter sp.]